MYIFRSLIKQLVNLISILLASSIGSMGIAYAASPNPVDLGAPDNYAILSKVGITTTGVTSIIGNIGVSPITVPTHQC